MVLGIFRKLVAQNKQEISNKPIDVYTVGHILMGVICYVIIFSFFGMVGVSNWISLVGTILFGVVWEYIENFIISKTILKHQKRKDSLENSLTDVVFTAIGGFIGFIFGLEVSIIFIVLFTIMVLYNLVYYKHVMP